MASPDTAVCACNVCLVKVVNQWFCIGGVISLRYITPAVMSSGGVISLRYIIPAVMSSGGVISLRYIVPAVMSLNSSSSLYWGTSPNS